MPYIHQQDYGLPSDAANHITNQLPGSGVDAAIRAINPPGSGIGLIGNEPNIKPCNEIIVHNDLDNTVTVELFRALSNFYCGDLTKTAKALLLVLEVRDSTKPTIKS